MQMNFALDFLPGAPGEHYFQLYSRPQDADTVESYGVAERHWHPALPFTLIGPGLV